MVAILLLPLAPVLAQKRDPSSDYARKNFLPAFKECVAGPSRSTVRILCDGKETALGMVVGADGWILTKANDLTGTIAVRLKSGETQPATLVGVHGAHDLAMLKIEAKGLVPVDFLPSKEVVAGSWLACPGPSDEPVAVGVVSVPPRTVASKGPVADPAKSAYLGVALEEAPTGGVVVKEVVPSPPAAKAGLKKSDVLLSVAGREVQTPEQMLKVLAGKKPGDTVVLQVKRGTEEFQKSVVLERRPLGSYRGEMQNRMGSELSSRRHGYASILQHDSVMKPSDCGGPIVDLAGRVIGINICRAGRVESWAVPSETLLPLLTDLKSGKLAPKRSPEERRADLERRIVILRKDVAKLESDDPLPEEKVLEDARKAYAAATAELKVIRTKEAHDTADQLLKLMQNRLVVMNDVAGWKWNHRQEIFDPAREKATLDSLTARAKELKLDPSWVGRFFKSQFEAARLLQQDRIAAWQKDNVSAPARAELKRDLRPRIDQISEDLLDTLARLQPLLRDSELGVAQRIRQTSGQMLAGQGITDAVRGKAMENVVP